MNVEEMPDPILRALAGLRPMAPSKTHDDHVRSRCHDVLARRWRRRSTRGPRSARARALDVVLAFAVALYVAIGVTEAAWLAFGS
jgi:hypothetical protein